MSMEPTFKLGTVFIRRGDDSLWVLVNNHRTLTVLNPVSGDKATYPRESALTLVFAVHPTVEPLRHVCYRSHDYLVSLKGTVICLYDDFYVFHHKNHASSYLRYSVSQYVKLLKEKEKKHADR